MSDVCYKQICDCLNKPLTVSNLRRIFALTLKYHYSDKNNYGSLAADLGCLVHDPTNPNGGSLVVDLYHAFKSEATSQQPGVYIGFQPVNFTKKVVNNDAGGSEDNAEFHYAMVASTNMLITHIHQNADTALALGDSSATLIAGIREPLMHRLDYQLMGLDVGTMTDALKVESDPTPYFKVDLLCPLTFNFAVTTNMESHRLKKFESALQPE